MLFERACMCECEHAAPGAWRPSESPVRVARPSRPSESPVRVARPSRPRRSALVTHENDEARRRAVERGRRRRTNSTHSDRFLAWCCRACAQPTRTAREQQDASSSRASGSHAAHASGVWAHARTGGSAPARATSAAAGLLGVPPEASEDALPDAGIAASGGTLLRPRARKVYATKMGGRTSTLESR
jgi:hypothetical protein